MERENQDGQEILKDETGLEVISAHKEGYSMHAYHLLDNREVVKHFVFVIRNSSANL